MTNQFIPRDLFAAKALHALMPFVLEQESNEAMKEAMALAVTSAWATADAMMDIRNAASSKQ